MRSHILAALTGAAIVLGFTVLIWFVANSGSPEEAAHREWCNRIYHQNVGCPKFGEIELPPEVAAKQAAERIEWCEAINFRNPVCFESPYS